MSTDTEQKPAALAVVEEKDGSAVVQLPDDVQSPDGETDDEGSADDAQAAASGDEDAGGDDDRPGDTDAVREARRNRRKAKKEYIRRTNEEKDQRLALLQRQNQELMERLSVVERKTHSSDLARLDKAIEDEELRYQYFEVKKREAINNSDGDAFNKAQEGWYEARRKIEAMRAVKQKAVETTPQDGGALDSLRDLIARPYLRGEVVWSSPTETLKQVYSKMQLFDVSQVPVMDGRKVIGIVDEAEVLLRVAEHTGKGFATPVGEVMRPDFATIDVKTPVERLLRVFERSKIGRAHV